MSEKILVHTNQNIPFHVKSITSESQLCGFKFEVNNADFALPSMTGFAATVVTVFFVLYFALASSKGAFISFDGGGVSSPLEISMIVLSDIGLDGFAG